MKRYSILSLMFALALGFLVASCGKKVDEAMVAEFNAKKTEAEKLIADADAGAKKMMEDHTAWAAKLDEAAKLPNADTVKLAGFKAEMEKHMTMGKDAMALVDSLKSYVGAKTDNADALKTAVAGLTTNIGALTANWKTMMDAHTKLGEDITAAIAPAAAPAAEEKAAEPKKEAPKAPAKPEAKKPTTSQGGVSKKDGAAAPAPAPKPATTSQGGVSKK